MGNDMQHGAIIGASARKGAASLGAFGRATCAFALAFALAVASLAVVPLGASVVLDAPMPAWAGGVDEAVADEGGSTSPEGESAGQSSSDATATSANANGLTTQAAASDSSSSAASSASAAQSASTSSRAETSGDASANRGYVGPWYALNDNYVVQVEERFDSIVEDEYMATMSRTALIVVAAVAVVLAIIMFLRARSVQAKARKRRR